jgi:hypothetical protein
MLCPGRASCPGRLPAAGFSAGNPEVGSLGQCVACHTNMESGSCHEAEINIPGYGRWEDIDVGVKTLHTGNCQYE